MEKDYLHLLENIPSKEIFKGFKGKFIHTNRTSLAFWEIEKGSELPLHSHPHEQTVIMMEGELEIEMDGKIYRLSKGKVLTIPGNMPHSGRTIENTTVLDVFSPVREDYK